MDKWRIIEARSGLFRKAAVELLHKTLLP